ncbi:ribosomal protein S7 [Streptococcus pyogenes MGAS2111]|nr:ribosomal protein S7 [Streptococcus pyogenes MGAS2111]
MSRKNQAPKREVLPDPLYNSKIVTRLINRVMLDGKRGTAATIVYDAFSAIKEATGNDALEVFETAMDNIMPVLEVRARRVGGSNYQVPVEVRPERRTTLGLRWLVNASRARGEHTMKDRLAKESWMLQTTQVHQLRNVKTLTKWLKLTVPLLTSVGNIRYFSVKQMLAKIGKLTQKLQFLGNFIFVADICS